jgi:hypothetical protein
MPSTSPKNYAAFWQSSGDSINLCGSGSVTTVRLFFEATSGSPGGSVPASLSTIYCLRQPPYRGVCWLGHSFCHWRLGWR